MSSSPHLAPEAYRAILESLPAGVYLVDRDRRILFWNDGAERLSGYFRHEVIGRRCADDFLMHCDEFNEALCGSACPLVDTMHDGRPREADLFLRHKNGQRVPVRVRSAPIRDEGGAVIGACEYFDERVVFISAGHRETVDLSPSLDEQTQLPGRHALRKHLESLLVDFRASGIPFGVLAIAIDNLEGLRASGGNNVVGSVFYSAGQTFAKNVGIGNLVGRWSHTRFLATLAGCSAATLLSCAVRLKRLAGLAAVPWWGNRLSFSVSIGGSVVRDRDTADTIIQRACTRLDACLEKGGNHAAVD